MNKIFCKNLMLVIITVLFGMSVLNANETKKTLPNINIKDLMGKTINVQDFDNDGKPIIISFWATWCKPCLEELSTINDLYEDWKAETGVKIIAISIDDSRNSRRVAPFVKAKDWQYEVYLDENSDLRRALGINNPPHTLLLDGNKNIVFEHSGYAAGDEIKLFEQVKKIVAAE
jgi:thiol-disulfide isomerase/thioredoxin